MSRSAVVLAVVVSRGVFREGVASAARLSLVDAGERRSNRPSTCPFFCGVGPMALLVRTEEGVDWADGAS